MADSARDNLTVLPVEPAQALPAAWLRPWGTAALGAAVVAILVGLALTFYDAAVDSPLVVESTPGQLVLWMVGQSALEAPAALLGQLARSWAAASGQPQLDEATALAAARTLLVLPALLAAALALVGTAGIIRQASWARSVWLGALLGLDTLVLIVPVLDGENAAGWVLVALALTLVILLLAPGRVTRLLGFMVVVGALLLAWEAAKAFGAAVQYRITLPQPSWTVTTYPTLDGALAALEAGEVAAVIADRKSLQDIIPAMGADPAGLPYPELRLLASIQTASSILGLPIIPTFPGRLNVAARANQPWASIDELIGQPVGGVAGDFANDRYLNQPRALQLLDLGITNDLNLPHLQSIAEALFLPARRNGPVLLLRILLEAALDTWSKAAAGFVIGGLLGFVLGTLFAHFKLLERGLLPYVVASQTVPILAIAPMVVIWLGAGFASVAVISAYLTFFPVTINTLRGLTSPHPTALELMHSYAASRWTTLWKLRFPAALPYIFTALKVSATASVVGAIIGELPSGIRTGLGGAILNFNQYYTSDPAKLWAAIFISALVGIAFFVLVTLVERVVLGRQARE